MWQSGGMTLGLGRFEALTFDCYGTLIDWEAGIVAAMRRLLGRAGDDLPDDAILETHAHHEARIEAGSYQPYRDVLVEVGRAACTEHGVEPGEQELARFGGSVVDWPAFPDSPAALARLAVRFRLGIITNCDDDLFAASMARLGVAFDPIVTAQQVGSYKPDRRNFEAMLERIGVPRERILHVAQSLFHDHVPAKALGLTTAWIDRRHDREGFGATPPAEAIPDLTVPDMASLADLATGIGER
jgi:2-haloacid dehalogenase